MATIVVIKNTYRLDIETLKFKQFETEELAKQFCAEYNTPEMDPYKVKYGSVAEILPMDVEIGSEQFKEY